MSEHERLEKALEQVRLDCELNRKPGMFLGLSDALAAVGLLTLAWMIAIAAGWLVWRFVEWL